MKSVMGICIPLHQLCSLASLNKAVMLYRLAVWFTTSLKEKRCFLASPDVRHTHIMGNSDTSQRFLFALFRLFYLSANQSRNYKYASGQKQNNSYFTNEYYFSHNMEGIYFQSPLITLSPSEVILQPPWRLSTLRMWITDMENRKSITILHPWPSPPLFFPLYCSGTMWEPSYTCPWPHFPCGWHNLLPLHCVFLYGGLFPYWLSHTPMSGKWHVVWHGSKLHEWVGYAQKHEGILDSCLLVLWNTLKRPLRSSDFMLWNEKKKQRIVCSLSKKTVKWSVSVQWDVVKHSPNYTSAVNRETHQSTIQFLGWSHLAQSHLHLHWHSQNLLPSLSEIEQKNK